MQVFKYVKKLSNVDHANIYELQSNTKIENNDLPMHSEPCSTDIVISCFFFSE